MNKTLYNFLLAYFVVSVGIIIFGGGTFVILKYQESQQEVERLSDNNLISGEKEVESLVKKVGALIVLPKEEEPVIATVSDVEKIKESQPFFKNAKNGDKVLIYQSAKKAFLYNPNSDKVVDVGFINSSDQSGLTKEGD